MTIQNLSVNNNQRVAFEAGGLEVVKLQIKPQISGKPNPAPANLYWDGQTNLAELVKFFSENYPHTTSSSFSALVWRGDDEATKVRINRVKSLQAFVDCIPEDAAFVRLEHADNNKPSVSPDFIVWSRVDSPINPTNFMGVSGDVAHLTSLTDPLATLISDTHIGNVKRDTALDGVRGLLIHLTPV